MFRLSTFVPLGGVLYPWRCRTTITEEFIVIGLVPSPPVWNIRPDQFGSHRLPVPSDFTGVLAAQYRGFRRTLRCLAMEQAVARPAGDGDVRYSSVCRLYLVPAEPGAIGQTPSIRVPSRIGPHRSGRSKASRPEGLDLTHRNLLAVLAH